jgi:hypothetical protein
MPIAFVGHERVAMSGRLLAVALLATGARDEAGTVVPGRGGELLLLGVGLALGRRHAIVSRQGGCYGGVLVGCSYLVQIDHA